MVLDMGHTFCVQTQYLFWLGVSLIHNRNRHDYRYSENCLLGLLIPLGAVNRN